MTCGIYKIENLINGLCYIGQSLNIEQRWEAHKKNITEATICYDYPLYQSIRKYGLDNFSFEIIEECCKEQLNEKEIYWIKFYNSFNNGYNQTLGGNNSSHFSKINLEILENIYNDLQESILSETQIANKYNLCLKSISLINVGEIWRDESRFNYPIRKNYKIAYCKKCGVKLTLKNSSTGLCWDCYNSSRNPKMPSKEILKQKIRNQSFESIAKEYGFKSGGSIKRWCKKMNLPYLRQDINKYSDEEWQLI